MKMEVRRVLTKDADDIDGIM